MMDVNGTLYYADGSHHIFRDIGDNKVSAVYITVAGLDGIHSTYSRKTIQQHIIANTAHPHPYKWVPFIQKLEDVLE